MCHKWCFHPSTMIWVLAIAVLLPHGCQCNLPPVFTQDMNNMALSEATPVDTIVYKLEGYDPEGSNVSFGLVGSENFDVDPQTGEVRVVKPLDREIRDKLSFLVSIKDRVDPSGLETENDNLVKVPISVIVLDENDNAPEFQNTPYETDVLEDATMETTVFDKIRVTDRDSVGENLEISCVSQSETPDACEKFSVVATENDQNHLIANVVLRGKLDHNARMIYHMVLSATDGVHTTETSFEVRVKDVQNSPPIFQGSLAAIIDEDSAIGTLVMTVQARDGDRGNPRAIVFDLLTNPMDYFLLDAKTGELRTAKPLDREALPDATGLVTLTVRAREVVDGVPVNDALTATTTTASVTIRDVNDSPPTFDQKEYHVSLSENTAPGTPLPLAINVHDPDVGQNSVFSLRLEDVSGVFDVEPKVVYGSSQVSIRVANGSLDFENPNQRKFIVLIVAEELKTEAKLSSTATLTVTITDANDNKPIFEQESYSTTVSEAAQAGQSITVITAKDLDSGAFGDQGIRYSLSGTGAELFNVDQYTGAITVADCPKTTASASLVRRKRQDEANVNITLVGQTGIVHNDEEMDPATVAYKVISAESAEDFAHDAEEHTTDAIEVIPKITLNPTQRNFGPGWAPCLDFETHAVYYLSYKATDDEGRGQTSVVSLRISLTDANDSPPVCESPLYRASIDEGATLFDPPLFIKARDPDTVSDLSYKIVGNEMVYSLFTIDKRTGQLQINKSASLDVNHLNSDHIAFAVEATDGLFTTLCDINITIRDVNNHAPQFTRENYVTSIAENTAINTVIEQVRAIDLDTGINAGLQYRIQQGSFDDFSIDTTNGNITVMKKLDYDRRNTYKIEVVASDMGTPSLSGTATLTVSILNINDKDPYFTPTTQRAEVPEDAPIGTVIHTLVALDPDISNIEALDYSATEPITAVDKDGKEVQETDDFKDMFSIDRTGRVTVNRKLNRDLYAVIRITSLVTDTTAPSIQQGKGLLVITIIDVNEQPPEFVLPWTSANPYYNFQITEEVPIGTVLTTLQATDADSNIEKYTLANNSYFAINESTGVIQTIARLDYEAIKEVRLDADVTDTGVPQLSASAIINVQVVNINDNEPIFSQPMYKAIVQENAPKGTVVLQVEAKDLDDGQYGVVTYALIGDDAQNFEIDPATGIVTVLNTTVLDREVRSHIVLMVSASDKAPSTTRRSTVAPIHISIMDVNDNPPIFDQKLYQASIAENAAFDPPAAILQVSATDKDDGAFGEPKYSIISGNELGLFHLDPNSGILYPGKSLRGLEGKYQLVIEARDGLGTGPFSDNAKISIEVTSINKYRPVFIMPALPNATVELQENFIEENYLVMTVKASDKDTGENGHISYHLQEKGNSVQETNEFIIDSTSGELRTKMRLNRKEKSRYDLILMARDHGASSLEKISFLTILLVDASENKPEFPDASNPYNFIVTENAPPNLRIGKIQAMIGGNKRSEIYYYMILGNRDGAFYVDKTTGDVFTNRSLNREEFESYHLYILASKKSEMLLHDLSHSVEDLERDSTVAKVMVTVHDVNDNAPQFEHALYYAGVSNKAPLNELVAIVNATDLDYGVNGTLELIITASNLHKFGATKSVGSIVPSPFAISKEGRITTATFVAEYNQDRFELEVVAKEVRPPERAATATVLVWIFNSDQLVRVILSRPPAEVNAEKEEIIAELRNATQKIIVVDEIKFHVDSVGRVRMDWCDLFFHAIDPTTQMIVPVDDILRVIDSHYDFLKEYYAGYAIENVVPAHSTYVEEEFDLALAGLVALIIVLFVGAISFIVICFCLKHWSITIPSETRRKDALIKKQIIDDLNTTENPLWIEQKLRLYEEQELTMQVFSEPENHLHGVSGLGVGGGGGVHDLPSPHTDVLSGRRDSYEVSQMGDNTYATIQPRVLQQLQGDMDDYATLRNSIAPSLYEFTGSTFQAPISTSASSDQDNYITELI